MAEPQKREARTWTRYEAKDSTPGSRIANAKVLKHPCIVGVVARRKRKEDEFQWVPPEFDEVGFMRQEIAGTKAAVVTIAWAAAGAIVSFLLYNIAWVLAFFVGLFFFAGLLYVMPILGVRTTNFKRKDWTGHAVTYFFSWLAFWILLLNVPVSDITAPTINGISAGSYYSAVGVYNATTGAGSVTCYSPQGSTIPVRSPPPNDTLYVIFRATDNVGVASLRVTVNTASVTPELVAGDKNVCRGAPIPIFPQGTYVVRIPVTVTFAFSIEVTASDAAGHSVAVGFNVQAQS